MAFMDTNISFFSPITETVEYIPISTGTAVSVTALVNRQGRNQEEEFMVENAVITVESSAIATPNPEGDTMFFDGVTWDVIGRQLAGSKIVISAEYRKLYRRTQNVS